MLKLFLFLNMILIFVTKIFFDNGVVVTALIILRIIVLGVFTITYYKNIFTTVHNVTSNIVSNEVGVQTEELVNTTSCEDITSVGSESSFPNLVDVDSVGSESNYPIDSVGSESDYPNLEDVDSVGSESDFPDLVNADDNFYDIADPFVFYFHNSAPSCRLIEYTADGTDYLFFINIYGIFSIDPAIYTLDEFWQFLYNH